MFLCLIRRCAALLLLLCVSSGCHRASYVFQPPTAGQGRDAAPVMSPVAAIQPLPGARRQLIPPARRHRVWPAAFRRTAPRIINVQPAERKNRVAGTLVSVAFDLAPMPAGHHSRAAKKEARPGGRAATPGAMTYRSRGVAVLLAVVLGVFGAHLFYLGHRRAALLRLVGGLLGAGAALLAIPLGNTESNGLSGALVALTLLLFGGGAILGLFLLGLVDAVRIITGSLQPSNGMYHPRFFQTKPDAEPPTH